MLPSSTTLFRLLVVVAALGSLLAVYALSRPRGEWGARLRQRFVLGLPWGTLTVVGFVLAVYLFVQGGYAHWYSPTVIPFRAWSYFYPLGILTASFTHAGPGHLLGNLVGTLTLAPLVEYAWGHFPRERGSSSFADWRSNPFVRAFVVFPGVTLLAGVVFSAFAIGPVIGFSGVVFAFAGFALTRYPIGTVVGLTVGNVVSQVRTALLNPVSEASGRPAFITPWWADIAIQGHALGLLGGVLLGVVYARRRGDAPSALRIWAGGTIFAVSQSLWAVYWYRGGQTYVLYRALGTALVFGLGTVLAAAVAGDDEPLFGRLAAGVEGPAESFVAAVRTASARQIGVVALIVSASALAGPAVPVNLLTTSGGDLPGSEVHVGDYEVTYAEDVENGMVSVVNVSVLGETTSVDTSGVIVRSTDRGIWTTAASKGQIAFAGRTRVRVGGIGWRDSVLVTRTGWNAVGDGTAYRINFTYDGETRPMYLSERANASPVIAGRNVSIAPAERTFYVVVARNNTTRQVAPIPRGNETVTVGGIDFVRENRSIVAHYDDTVVTVFKKERYRETEQ